MHGTLVRVLLQAVLIVALALGLLVGLVVGSVTHSALAGLGTGILAVVAFTLTCIAALQGPRQV